MNERITATDAGSLVERSAQAVNATARRAGLKPDAAGRWDARALFDALRGDVERERNQIPANAGDERTELRIRKARAEIAALDIRLAMITGQAVAVSDHRRRLSDIEQAGKQYIRTWSKTRAAASGDADVKAALEDHVYRLFFMVETYQENQMREDAERAREYERRLAELQREIENADAEIERLDSELLAN